MTVICANYSSWYFFKREYNGEYNEGFHSKIKQKDLNEFTVRRSTVYSTQQYSTRYLIPQECVCVCLVGAGKSFKSINIFFPYKEKSFLREATGEVCSFFCEWVSHTVWSLRSSDV